MELYNYLCGKGKILSIYLSIYHKKHFCILPSSQRCTQIFTLPSFMAFRRSNNLGDILVKSTLPTNPQTQPLEGSYKCGTNYNCLTCNYINDGRADYTFSATKETRQIPYYIDCNSKNLIYMKHYRRCNNQYKGETKRTLKDRFNKHPVRRPVDRPGFTKSRPAAHGPLRPSGPRLAAGRPSPDFPQFFCPAVNPRACTDLHL